MTERTPTISPETQRELAGVPDGLQPSVLDCLIDMRADADAPKDDADFEAYRYGRIEETLAEHGLSPDDDAQKQSDYSFAKGVYLSVSDLNFTNWNGKTNDSKPQRAQVAELIDNEFESRLMDQRKRESEERIAQAAERKRVELEAAIPKTSADATARTTDIPLETFEAGLASSDLFVGHDGHIYMTDENGELRAIGSVPRMDGTDNPANPFALRPTATEAAKLPTATYEPTNYSAYQTYEYSKEEAQSPEDKRSAELLKNLTQARERWASVSAKRQGRAYEKNDNRKAIEADYHTAVNAYIAHDLADLLALNDEDKTSVTLTRLSKGGRIDDYAEMKEIAVLQHLFNEQEELRDLTRKKLTGTPLNKIVTFMNTGNLPVRIAKGVGVGAAAGFLGTLLAGAAGAGVLAGGAVATSRFVKGYAAHDKNIGTKSFEDDVDIARLEQWHAENGEHTYAETSLHYTGETFEQATVAEQKKRRIALVWGAGSVALGATLGYAAGRTAGLNWKVTEAVKNWFDNTDTPRFHIDLPDDIHAPELPGTPDGIDSDGDGVADSEDFAPNNPDIQVKPDIQPETGWTDFSPKARIVEPGEGGFQTLKEMGIPDHKLDKIWADAGSKLANDGKTYKMEDGNWGWNREMRLTDRDLTIISKVAARNGVNV